MARLEHLNVTVADPDRTAALLQELFGWRIRWSGPAIHGGRSVHVGDGESYLALYAPPEGAGAATGDSYRERGGLNHVGIVVEDLAAAEARITARGYRTHSHADYEPGQRFYFDDENGIEFEVVSYAETAP